LTTYNNDLIPEKQGFAVCWKKIVTGSVMLSINFAIYNKHFILLDVIESVIFAIRLVLYDIALESSILDLEPSNTLTVSEFDPAFNFKSYCEGANPLHCDPSIASG
jgi:hypothetical protein